VVLRLQGEGVGDPFRQEAAVEVHRSQGVVRRPTRCKVRVQPLCFCVETALLAAVAEPHLLQRCRGRKAHLRRTSDRSIEHSPLQPGTVH